MMTPLLSQLLVYPFEKDCLPWPQVGQKTLVHSAQYFSEVHHIETLDCVQSFKSYADLWAQNDYEVFQKIDEHKKYSFALYGVAKQKEAAFYDLACCLNALEDDGILIAVAANDAGGKRLEKWFMQFGLVPESLSKSKCKIVWAHKKTLDHGCMDKSLSAGAAQKISVSDEEFITKPGVFGWNKIDKGSQLLVEALPNNLSGAGADFGCGYGYLSNKILDGDHQIKKLYAVDADYHALECCEENLKKYKIDIDYMWEDLTASQNISNLDWIIMNPPFHDGKEMSTPIGQKFIETAVRSLRKNGVLYVVANAHLPYEKTLEHNFSNVQKVMEEQGFKVFIAIK